MLTANIGGSTPNPSWRRGENQSHGRPSGESYSRNIFPISSDMPRRWNSSSLPGEGSQ